VVLSRGAGRSSVYSAGCFANDQSCEENLTNQHMSMDIARTFNSRRQHEVLVFPITEEGRL